MHVQQGLKGMKTLHYLPHKHEFITIESRIYYVTKQDTKLQQTNVVG